MASYLRLTEQDDAGVPTPPTGKVNIFVDDVTGEPSMKNDAGTVTTLKGVQGDPGEGVPTGGTAGQRLAKIDGTDYNTEWVDPVDASPLTTKGDIFVYGTDNDRLPVGTNGQALVADSTQALGVKWDDVAGASPLTTKGDILTYDTDDARLPVGANGSILTADSAETTGIKWGDPADIGSYLLLGSLSDVTTGSVADGDVLTFDSGSGEWINAPASGGGSSPLTTKGDVYVYGSADARLPVGTDGQVLTADSAQTLGVKWATAGAGDVTAAGNNTFTGTNSFSSNPTTFQGLTFTGANGSGFQTTQFRPNAGTRALFAQFMPNGDSRALFQCFNSDFQADSTNYQVIEFGYNTARTSAYVASLNAGSKGKLPLAFSVGGTTGDFTGLTITTSDSVQIGGNTSVNGRIGINTSTPPTSGEVLQVNGNETLSGSMAVSGRIATNTSTTPSSGAYIQTPNIDITGANDSGTLVITNTNNSAATSVTDLAIGDVVLVSYQTANNGGGALFTEVSNGAFTVRSSANVTADTTINWRVIH